MSVVEGLIRTYPGFELRIPRWEIADTGITALWGPSGAGKTTIFRILIGLESCPGLRWNFMGEDLALLSVPLRHLGVVFQAFELFPHLSARENLEFAARARGVNVGSKIEELSEDLKMGEFLDRRASVLSGGEAQRVALARAVIGKPRFLFLDEPFSSLDFDLRQSARALVRAVIEKYKIPTLLITHDREDLRALAGEVVEIQAGQIKPGTSSF